jgi:hypothetical protein
MKFYFKIVFDQDGNVLGVEPPQGTILTCNGIDKESTEAEKEIRPLTQKISISEDIEILKKPGDPCVRVGNKLWCW